MNKPDCLFAIDDRRAKYFNIESVSLSYDLLEQVHIYFPELSGIAFGIGAKVLKYRGIWVIGSHEFATDIMIFRIKDDIEEIVYDIKEDVEYKRIRWEEYIKLYQKMVINGK